MPEDSLMRQIREAKDAYARSFNYDLDAIVADLRAADAGGDWPVVRLSPRRPAGSNFPQAELDPVIGGTGRFVGEVEAVRERPEGPRRIPANGAVGLPDPVGPRGAEAPYDRADDRQEPRHIMSPRSEDGTMSRIEVGDAVGLAVDIPALGLAAGEVGAAVAILADGGYKVEFRDHSGETYASLALRAGQLLALHSRGQALRSGLHVV